MSQHSGASILSKPHCSINHKSQFLCKPAKAMEALPAEIVQHILCLNSNAKDVASCSCVSKRWKDSTPYSKSLHFPRNIFDTTLKNGETPDTVVSRMVAMVNKLEDLVVYCPFMSSSLLLWLSKAGPSLKKIELRLDNINQEGSFEEPSKLDCLSTACNLESIKLWAVLMVYKPKWNIFHKLTNLEIVGARIEDYALHEALHACPKLIRLLLLGCEGPMHVVISNPHLEQCVLSFVGVGNTLLTINSPKLKLLDVQGCGLIKVPETQLLKTLSIANSSGRVYHVDFGKLVALETLTVRGVQWCWNALSNMLQMAGEVKNLCMKVEFTGEFIESFLPFPEIDLVDFFNSHPKLQTLEIHGAMFAALCQKNSLKHVQVGSCFSIPYLEKAVITVRSPLNAEQKMNMLDSLVKYSKNLKKMTINILQMKSSHSSADDFFDDICRFRYKNRKIVSIQ